MELAIYNKNNYSMINPIIKIVCIYVCEYASSDSDQFYTCNQLNR